MLFLTDRKQGIRFTIIGSFLLVIAHANNLLAVESTAKSNVEKSYQQANLQVGAERLDHYLPLLAGKRVALLINQTSQVGGEHLLDLLLAKGVNVTTLFAPEHGFRGDQAAGEKVSDQRDGQTGLPVYSLYGKHKKPRAAFLKQVDILIFDIQDVGVRFYTYLSSLHYYMQACAEFNIPLILLDRPNPNGAYIDGPVLKPQFRSFLGLHPIPLLHGLTLGEAARMIQGEGWLTINFKPEIKAKQPLRCDLTVIPMANYRHNLAVSLPIKPSTNLPNDLSVQLYPSLALFEATSVSVGRGTDWPFQVLGFPDPKMGDFSFIPRPIKGSWQRLNYANKRLYGERITRLTHRGFSLSYFLAWRDKMKAVGLNLITRPKFLDNLTGDDEFRRLIEQGQGEEAIRATWQKDLQAYRLMRSRYLLYPDG